MSDSAATSSDVPPQARRNAIVLAVAQAFSGSAPAIVIALGGLTGAYLLGPDKSLATLPISTFMIGTSAGAIPAARLMQAFGRRMGFTLGSLLGIVGALIGAFAVMGGSFVVFTAGMTVGGLAMSFVQQYRFAAADEGSAAFRAKAISWVLVGGVASAVIGPQTAIFTRDLMSPVPFAGAFFGMAAVSFLGLIVIQFLGGSAREAPKVEMKSGGRSLGEIVSQPLFIVALICGIGAYALMSLLMTAAPLAMVHHAHSHADAALGIQWHVLAMFVPSFFTGALIARYGQITIIGIGFILLAICCVIALMGVDLMNFWLALILLGIGWNFGFIGSTTMLTETYRPEEKSRVQGLNDFLVFGSVAIASLLSGQLFATLGWNWINVVAFPAIAICLIALAIAAMQKRQPVA